MIRRGVCLALCVLVMLVSGCKKEEKTDKENKPGNSSISQHTTAPTTEDDNVGNNENEPVKPTLPKEEDPFENLPNETAEEALSVFVAALKNGDWEQISNRIASFSVVDGNKGAPQPGGIIERIMTSCTITTDIFEKNEDGSCVVTLCVEAVDYRALISALPSDIGSAEAARKKMLELAETSPKKTYFGILELKKTENIYLINPDISFINAITGGFFDFYAEMLKGEIE